MGGWVGGVAGEMGLKLISTQVVVEVEVGVELGNIKVGIILLSIKFEYQ